MCFHSRARLFSSAYIHETLQHVMLMMIQVHNFAGNHYPKFGCYSVIKFNMGQYLSNVQATIKLQCYSFFMCNEFSKFRYSATFRIFCNFLANLCQQTGVLVSFPGFTCFDFVVLYAQIMEQGCNLVSKVIHRK